MFAGAAREAVFSKPEVIRRVNADFVPVALKAALVNRPRDDEEGLLYREIERSKPAPQGICVVNSAGKVLDWTLMFDDDKSLLAFFDHAKERFARFPDAKQPVPAEVYSRFPSQRRPDVGDSGKALPVLDRHPEGKRCPAEPTLFRGTVVARVFGRALDKDGKPVADVVRQENYIEDRFNIAVPTQEALAKALADGRADRVTLPLELTRQWVKQAYMGVLDVQPLDNPNPGPSKGEMKKCDFWATKVGAGKGPTLWRVEGESEVFIDERMATAGPGDMHEVKLKWHGFIEMDGSRMTRLVLSAGGKEKLKFNSARGKDENEVASLPGGRRIDMACEVRFGILGEPASPDKVAADAPATPQPGVLDEAPRRTPTERIQSIQRKLQRIQAGVGQWAQAGRDPSPIAAIMQEFEPLMKVGKVNEAEAVLGRALKALGQEPDAKPEPAKPNQPKPGAASKRNRAPQSQGAGRAAPASVRLGKIAAGADQTRRIKDGARMPKWIPQASAGLIALPLRDRYGKLQIFTINPDGTGKKQLTFEGDNGRPDWSPDGRKIAFMSVRGGRPPAIWVMNGDGTNQRFLSEGLTPDWSPDGSKIAYASFNAQIFVMDADGRNRRQITNSRTHKAGPSWSPDGRQMVFILVKNPGSNADFQPEIGIMNADGTNERILTSQDRTNKRKNPDGTITVLGTAHDANAPSWSPAENKIAFWSGIEGAYGQVWTVNADGTGSTQLTEAPNRTNNDDPSWSPDGKRILFGTNRSGKNELWVMDADGENEKRVSDLDAAPFPGRASWQPVYDKVAGDASGPAQTAPQLGVPDEARRQIVETLGPPFIVFREKVQAELKLSAEQKEKVQKRLQDTVLDAMQFFQKLGDKGPEEREKSLRPYREKAQDNLTAFLKQTLKEEQLKRLRQLELQQDGPLALMARPELGQALKITAEQRQQFMAVVQEMQAKIEPLVKQVQSGGNPQEIRTQIMKVRRDHESRLEALLTDAQKKQWKEMLGKPLVLND